MELSVLCYADTAIHCFLHTAAQTLMCSSALVLFMLPTGFLSVSTAVADALCSIEFIVKQ